MMHEFHPELLVEESRYYLNNEIFFIQTEWLYGTHFLLVVASIIMTDVYPRFEALANKNLFVKSQIITTTVAP